MKIEPYLFFEGRCDEAINFYKKVLGAKVNTLMRHKDNPEPPPAGKVSPELAEKVMHANLQIGESQLLLSDGHCQGKATFTGFFLPITVSSDADARRIFGALEEGGKVCMPLAKTFFSSSFGMVNDRFGVPWMILVQ